VALLITEQLRTGEQGSVVLPLFAPFRVPAGEGRFDESGATMSANELTAADEVRTAARFP